MKGIRGLLEKDFRLFLRQGGNLFLVLAVVAIFFILTGKMGADFIAVYIPSVMAVYSGNTISYDENDHGYTYLFSLPVNKKIYVREKYILSFIMVPSRSRNIALFIHFIQLFTEDMKNHQIYLLYDLCIL